MLPGDAMRSSTTERRTRWYQSILLIQDSLHNAVASRAVGPCEPASTCSRPSFREPIPYLGDVGGAAQLDEGRVCSGYVEQNEIQVAEGEVS